MKNVELHDLPDGVHEFGEFDSLIEVMEYGVRMPEGFSVYVMRHRVDGRYTVRAWLDDSEWFEFHPDQSAMQDYMTFTGRNALFMGTDHNSNYRSYWIWTTPDEDEAWDIAVAAEDLLKTRPRWNA